MLVELRFVQLQLRRGALVVGVGLLHQLLGAGECVVAAGRAGAWLRGDSAAGRRGGLDGRLGLADQRALHVLLVGEIGEGRLRRGQIGLGLRERAR